MKLNAFFIAVTLAIPAMAQSQSSPAELQQSPIDANVPPVDSFKGLMQRDLNLYFQHLTKSPAVIVEFKLLRDGPTQSGVAYPKYYLWVRLMKGSAAFQQGAARVAAIDGTRFEVTNYVTRSEIQSSPNVVASVFPGALIPKISALARDAP